MTTIPAATAAPRSVTKRPMNSLSLSILIAGVVAVAIKILLRMRARGQFAALVEGISVSKADEPRLLDKNFAPRLREQSSWVPPTTRVRYVCRAAVTGIKSEGLDDSPRRKLHRVAP